jgi:hypothetical protein
MVKRIFEPKRGDNGQENYDNFMARSFFIIFSDIVREIK